MAGRLPQEIQAARLVNYLRFRGIKCHCEQDNSEWLIWIEDESQVSESKDLLNEIKHDPDNEKFNIPEQEIKKLKKQERKTATVVRMSERWDRRMNPGTPVITATLMSLSVLVALVTNFGDKMENLHVGLFMSQSDFFVFPPDYWAIVGKRFTDGLVEVKSGEVWRIVTPIFVHLSPMHLIFNMMFMLFLAIYVESRLGFWKYLGFILGASIIPNLLQYFFFGPAFGGMSGVGYAVFAYLWLGSKWFHDIPPLDETTVLMAFIWLILGFTGLIGVANGAHGGGFLFGASWIIFSYYSKNLTRKISNRH
jgi:GlpG protein